MTVDEIRERVRRIAEMSADDEAAHGAEDDLHCAVLAAIASGADNPAELAAEALKTDEIEFARWCA